MDGPPGVRGSTKLNVAPRPISLSTQMRPPCSSTSLRVSAKPSPVPSCCRASEESSCSNSRDSLEIFRRDPDAGTDTEITMPSASPPRRDADSSPLGGELDGVAHEVVKDLLDLGPIGRRRAAGRRWG